MTDVFRVTVHHSGVRFASLDAGEAARQIAAIQRGHFDRGWADIGYHFLIDPAGRVWEGRSLAYQGAHAGDFALNQGNIGVCLLGDFTGQALPAAQTASLLRFLEFLRAEYKIPAGSFYSHRELHGTACPGPALAEAVHQFRATVGQAVMASR
ncbi:MAG: N-acetylmuramoyl-L-alanine amidase [Planctomycetes bacterium]|nr:N-acetylmuramoyl-L-alanine amidase [Planctomycetota bacterium]